MTKRQEYMKKYRAAHREEQAKYDATHYAAHREEQAAYDVVYRAAHPEQYVWHTMIQRCTNPQWKNYGALGIKVCKRWLSFAKFLADMGKRPSPKHSLSRIADSGNYEPGNVVWGTRTHQEEQKRIKRERIAAAA